MCDFEKNFCVFIRFIFGDECILLIVERKEGDDVNIIIFRLVKFMEVCLEEWLKYIDCKRDEY